jgi:predicted Zn-dependent protease
MLTILYWFIKKKMMITTPFPKLFVNTPLYAQEQMFIFNLLRHQLNESIISEVRLTQNYKK